MYRVIFLFLVGTLLVVELIFGEWVGLNEIKNIQIQRNIKETRDVSRYYPSSKPITYTRDQFGLRGSYEDVSKIDILTMGGSTTDQRHISDELTWQEQLTSFFSKDGQRIRIANAGMYGASTVGHLVAFDEWISKIPGLKTRYVLFYVGVDDFHVNYKAKPSSHPVSKSVRKHSIIYRLRSEILEWGRDRFKYSLVRHRQVDFSRKLWTYMPIRENHSALPSGFIGGELRQYRDRLIQLNQKVKSIGATPIFATQVFSVFCKESQIFGMKDGFPYRGIFINGVDAYGLMDKFNQTLLEVCREVGGVCLDIATEWEYIPEAHFYDFAHPNAIGTRELSSVFYGQLKSLFSP